MAVSKLQLILVGILAVQFLQLVDATCNQCKNSHACINETSFQICYNTNVRNDTISFTCPSETPICTDFSVICMPNVTTVTRGCGEVSKCNFCDTDATYACTSLTTFGRCSDGELTTGRVTCPNNKVCSTLGAANNGDICVSRCDVEDGDICDRIEEVDDNATTESPTSSTGTIITDSTTTSDGIVTDSSTTSNTIVTDSTTTSNTIVTDSTTISSTIVTDSTTTSSTIVTDSTTTSDGTVTDSSTSTTTANPNTPITPEAYCAEQQIIGRYAIPNDTECISYIYCFFRSGNWQTITYKCPTAQPYFNGTAGVCGQTKPTGINCTN